MNFGNYQTQTATIVFKEGVKADSLLNSPRNPLLELLGIPESIGAMKKASPSPYLDLFKALMTKEK